MTDQSDNQEVKLYAGKFKTVEELEGGYKNAAVVYDENEKLKQKFEEATRVPDAYQTPADIGLDAAHLQDYQARAREAGLTQAQYDKFLANEKARMERGRQGFEQARKEVGEETLNVLQDYVKNNYPESLQDGVLKTLITNQKARAEALSHREQMLGDQVPGVGKPAFTKYNQVTQEDVNKAAKAAHAAPSDMKARQKYVNLCEQLAAQKRAG